MQLPKQEIHLCRPMVQNSEAELLNLLILTCKAMDVCHCVTRSHTNLGQQLKNLVISPVVLMGFHIAL